MISPDAVEGNELSVHGIADPGQSIFPNGMMTNFFISHLSSPYKQPLVEYINKFNLIINIKQQLSLILFFFSQKKKMKKTIRKKSMKTTTEFVFFLFKYTQLKVSHLGYF